MSKERKPLGDSMKRKDIEETLKDINLAHSDNLNDKVSSKKISDNKEDKERVTHYLSKKSLSQLEELYDDLKQQLPYENKKKIKKSHLIEFGLQMLIRDFNERKTHSEVFIKLITPYLEG